MQNNEKSFALFLNHIASHWLNGGTDIFVSQNVGSCNILDKRIEFLSVFFDDEEFKNREGFIQGVIKLTKANIIEENIKSVRNLKVWAIGLESALLVEIRNFTIIGMMHLAVWNVIYGLVQNVGMQPVHTVLTDRNYLLKHFF